MRWEPSPRLRRISRWVGYPLFYLLALVLGLRLAFPFERLRQRVMAEFNSRQARDSGLWLEIDELSGYLLFGLEAEGIRLLDPGSSAERPTPTGGVPSSSASAGETAAEASPASGPGGGKKLIELEQVQVSVSPLRWLFGTVHLSFGSKAFGGRLVGSWTDRGHTRKLELEIDQIGLSEIKLLRERLNLPLGGKLRGKLELELPESRWSGANGKLDLTVEDLSVGDGVTKIRGALALPRCSAGSLSASARISEGKLEIEKFAGKGPDVEFSAEGQVRLRSPFKTSTANLSLRYRFTDRYMGKNEMTKALFGEPGSGHGGLMDLDPKVKRARLPDGFYAWWVTGTLGSLGFQPGSEPSRTTSSSRARSSGSRRSTR